MEQNTGPCAVFGVEVVGQDMKTTWGVSSNSGVSTGVCLPFGAGVVTGVEMEAGTNSLAVAAGLRVAFSWG